MNIKNSDNPKNKDDKDLKQDSSTDLISREKSDDKSNSENKISKKPKKKFKKKRSKVKSKSKTIGDSADLDKKASATLSSSIAEGAGKLDKNSSKPSPDDTVSYSFFNEKVELTEYSTKDTIDQPLVGSNAPEGWVDLTGSYNAQVTQISKNALDTRDRILSLGQIFLKTKTQVQKRLKAKYADNVIDFLDEALNRVAPHQDLTQAPTSPFGIIPKTINTLGNINVSGFLPNNHIQYYDSVNIGVDGITLNPLVNSNNNLYAIRPHNWNDYNLHVDQEDDIIQSMNGNQQNNPNGTNNITQNLVQQRVGAHDHNFERIAELINYNPIIPEAGYSADVDSATFFNSLKKVRSNLSVAYSSNPEFKLNQLITDPHLLFSSIVPSINLSTFLYLWIDSLKGNMDSIQIIGSKLGIVDTTLRFFVNVSKTITKRQLDAVNKLRDIFAYIPVNSKVIEAWNFLKHAGTMNDDDYTNENNPLIINAFRILTNFINSTIDHNSAPHYYPMRPHAATSTVYAPIGDIFQMFLSRINHSFSISGLIIPDSRPMINKRYTIDTTESHDHSVTNLALSYTRMTSTSASILAELTYGNRVLPFVTNYLIRTLTFWKALHTANAFDSTIFTYSQPDEFDFNSIGKLTIKQSPFSYLLNTPALFDYGRTTVPFFSQAQLVNHNVRKLATVWVNHSKDYVIVQNHTKFFMISNQNHINRDREQNNLNGIFITGAIYSPWFGKEHNDTSYSLGYNHEVSLKPENYTFTTGTNQHIGYLPVSFEWAEWRNLNRDNINVQQHVSFIFNNHHVGLYSSDNLPYFLEKFNTEENALATIFRWPIIGFHQRFLPPLNNVTLLNAFPFNNIDTTYMLRVEPVWHYSIFSPTMIEDYTVVPDYVPSRQDAKIS